MFRLVTDTRQTGRKNFLEGTWALVSGQQLPKGVQDIKIISGGHFVWVAYDRDKGKPFYTGGGTYILHGNSYTEHVDFMTEEISSGIVGKDQPFTTRVDGDTLTQTGALSNGQNLSETWKRIK